MTSKQAREIFFDACVGKTREEKEVIQAEYAPIAKIIHLRELEYATENNLLTSY